MGRRAGAITDSDSLVTQSAPPTAVTTHQTAPRVSWWREAATLFAKDLRAELRTLTAVSAIVVFAVAALLLIGLATKDLKAISIDVGNVRRSAWQSDSKMALLWVLLSFAAFVGLAHSFVHEEETGTTLALRLSMSAEAVYAGKLAFNFAVLLVVALLVTPLYMLITGMLLGPPVLFLLVMLSGCGGLAACATIIAALAAKAQATGALFSAIGLPFVVVLLLLLLHAAGTLYTRDATTLAMAQAVSGLLGFDVLLVTVSVLLFRFVWED